MEQPSAIQAPRQRSAAWSGGGKIPQAYYRKQPSVAFKDFSFGTIYMECHQPPTVTQSNKTKTISFFQILQWEEITFSVLEG